MVFDYLILNRPVFLLMDDFSNYLQARGGTYIKREELEQLFCCYPSADELVHALLNQDCSVFKDVEQRYNKAFDMTAFLDQLPVLQGRWSGLPAKPQAIEKH